MKKILLAEDDADFANVLKQYLGLHGFEVFHAADGHAALSLFQNGTFDLCVLDVMMPSLDGFSLAEQIIAIRPEVPFVFLTARQLKEDKIKGLQLGADDYITKPFEADELVLRIQNILKRVEKKQPTEIGMVPIGDYVFDAARLELTRGGTVQRLTEKEARLLGFLYENRNGLLKRDEILQAVWGNTDFFSGRSMDVFISRLRKYFAADPRIAIESIRNIGLEFKVK